MATYVNPIASATGGVHFSRLQAEEIKRLSVKKIHYTPTFDTLLRPASGGLYDPALGAIQALDVTCTTCRMNYVYCSGHCGHIELPVACYHPQYLSSTLRLLRAKCIYCHRLRLPRPVVTLTIGKLQLLQHGLVDDYRRLIVMSPESKRKRILDEDAYQDSGEDEDIDDFVERREKFVQRAIRKAMKRDLADRLTLIRNPAAIAERKKVITEFIQDMAGSKKCSYCQGLTPTYRTDRNTKIFKMPLSPKQRDQMKQAGMKAVNPLLYRLAEREERNAAGKHLTNGWHKEDVEIDDVEQSSSANLEIHGAEDEIAMQNALETTARAKNADLEDEDETQQYMTPTEVRAALDLLFDREQDILRLMFAPFPGRKDLPVTADMFFITHILVPPNKFRPVSRQGSDILEAHQNGALNRIIKASNDLQQITREIKKAVADSDSARQKRSRYDHISAGVVLQENVNAFIDHSPNTASGRQHEIGIKQTLEKKEGLFRMNMMGKRVNFAARSVISPDPNIETNEIGVPLVFAQKLTYPEPVTSHTFDQLSKAVINGMEKYPGASAIENENGLVLSLRNKNIDQRRALAKQLLTPSVPGLKGQRNKRVHRHLQSGDVVIMNRQPTLHKPSMMGHRARVLENEKTLRMHYSNCNTYNADFDGDEMNLHFPQNEIARSEALQIADTDHQYLSATAGKPLRGLIQDHISMGVQFTSRDVFFDRDQYQELLYNCLRPEGYNAIYGRIRMVQPAILKPRAMWTGKQVITTLLLNITPQKYEGLNLVSRSSTPADEWGETMVSDPASFAVTREKLCFRDTEQVVIFKGGEHICGILDKAQIGPSAGGLIHSIHELYGHVIAGSFLSILGRLFTRYLNERAWTCGMDDLYLTEEGDKARRNELSLTKRIGQEVAAKYVTLNVEGLDDRDPQLLARLESVSRNDDQLSGLDQMYKAQTKVITEGITKACLPAGLRKAFPRNQMQAMTISGAKGSSVNANLISCNLGQQVLEGKRVPTMVSGKTLPSFRAFETDPGAGGYVSGRFLTGINPQEYFFHAMSGREGLIDTAVKTSKSGYLQRCIVKGLEGLKTEYDTSVRESSNGTVVQFLYGEDGLEVAKQKHLKEFSFLAQNYASVSASINVGASIDKIVNDEIGNLQKAILKSVKKRGVAAANDPLTSLHPPASNLGSTSESFAADLTKYLKDNPDQLIKDKRQGINGVVSRKAFQILMDLKYLKSLVDPGEAVGVVAAQSVGEPSTQMTLNTFHLAGHSSKNVTLGIPRLREIIMTASAKIMTPTMTLKLIDEISFDDGTRFAKGISKLTLGQVIDELTVTERSGGGVGHEKERVYDIRLKLYPPGEYKDEYAITIADVSNALERKFVPKLEKLIKDEFRKKAREVALSETTAAVPDVGVSIGRVEEARPERTRDVEREGGEDDLGEEDDSEDAKQTAARERREDAFDEPDEDEAAMADESDNELVSDTDDVSATQNALRSSHKKPRALLEQNSDDSDTSGSTDEEAQAREDAIKANNPHVRRFIFSKSKGESCRIILAYDSKTPKLLLLPLLEKCAHASVIQSIPGLGQCMISQEPVKDLETGKNVMVINPHTGDEEQKKEAVVSAEGVNLLAMREYQDVINPHTLYTNSVHDMLTLYGVEAARATIVKEIDTVFKGHGISVDNRHINLIADAMTQSGGYKPFSRNGIVKEGGSVLAKMSFETVTGFLKEAVLFGESDPLLGPSSRIVAGRRGIMGTGCFDIVVPIQ